MPAGRERVLCRSTQPGWPRSHPHWLYPTPSSPSPSVGGHLCQHQPGLLYSHSAELVQDRHVGPQAKTAVSFVARLQCSGSKRCPHCVSSAVVPRRCAFRLFLSSPLFLSVWSKPPSLSAAHLLLLWTPAGHLVGVLDPWTNDTDCAILC